MSAVPAALSLQHIVKHFGTVQALNRATLEVRPGTVHAVLGENGAGKTTFMRVAYGMEAPDSGTVRIDGTAVRFRSPADAISLGVGMVHQHFTLVPAMTATENLALGGKGAFTPETAANQLRDLTRTTGLDIDPNAIVGDLSVSAQQRLELLKLLSRNARILILDEPTAVLAPSESVDLLRRLRQLADNGRAVVLITHKLREALDVADDVTVLRRGETTLARPRDSVDQNQLVNAMFGELASDLAAPLTATRSETRGLPVIVARDVSIVDAHGATRIQQATFEIRGGEVVGIAAIEGSGHRELMRALSGRQPASSGTLTLPPIVGFVPEDRDRNGLVLEMSLVENLAIEGAGSRRGFLRWKGFRAATREILSDFDVKAQNELVPARNLSGGNQQKLLLGRELRHLSSALIAENPTRGLDINAAAFIRRQLLEACSRGVAIVVHSQDLDELLQMSDRILVVFGGKVLEVPPVAEIVGRAMLGAA